MDEKTLSRGGNNDDMVNTFRQSLLDQSHKVCNSDIGARDLRPACHPVIFIFRCLGSIAQFDQCSSVPVPCKALSMFRYQSIMDGIMYIQIYRRRFRVKHTCCDDGIS